MQIQTVEFTDIAYDEAKRLWRGSVLLISADNTAHFICRARLDAGALPAEVRDELLNDALRQAARMPENRNSTLLNVTDPMRAKLIRAAA